MKNKLIVIGYTGTKSAFLNVPKGEAVRRFCEHHGILPATEEGISAYDKSMRVEEFEFDDEFEVYAAWAK